MTLRERILERVRAAVGAEPPPEALATFEAVARAVIEELDNPVLPPPVSVRIEQIEVGDVDAEFPAKVQRALDAAKKFKLGPRARVHLYHSAACIHEMHDECDAACRWCDVPCACDCHAGKVA